MKEHPMWISYPVPALIYDARQGVTLSRQLVYWYFVTLSRRSQRIPGDVQQFVADSLEEALTGIEDGDVSAAQKMFKPWGGKTRTAGPLYLDVHRSIRGTNDDKFEEMTEMGFRNAKNNYKAQKAREERISRVQKLLDEKKDASASLDGVRVRKIAEELIEIYKNPARLF